MTGTTTLSTANLAGGAWTIINTDDPSLVTVAMWLSDAIEEHTAAVIAATGRPVAFGYQLDGEDVDEDVCLVRDLHRQVEENYRHATLADLTTRKDRYWVLARLAASGATEVALITGVTARVAKRFTGDEPDARLARDLTYRVHHSDERNRA
ncbi:hypothetical protein [Clavibacter sp. VKM Ac-2872]|uniref:hypothetical protein n=1 Tax=Clavibacter sp. VKM Ac-2872 TaxID=2783812 RepID=UPI00188D3796|nr:hypothetical protein [Clavibacter sp. VKM Ac-2872]MBF4625848.1 hypothetical protein [Clavibacter sp. VKM Ac-2872]